MTSYDFEKNTAGVKAKEDVQEFLLQDGFKLFKMPSHGAKKLLYTILKLPLRAKKIDNGVMVIQFPDGRLTIRKLVLNALKKNSRLKIVYFIHDIESLRLLNSAECSSEEKETEIALLKQANGIISHNEKMARWLQNNGITCPIVNLKIFDYLSPFVPQPNHHLNKRIAFAGNLAKSSFLEKLNLHNYIIDAFGPNPSKEYSSCVNYKGVFAPSKLPNHLNQDFGLIWDGSVTDQCNGIYGNYLKYNDPHKASLYLSSGLPVIIWKQAALASFIEKNNLGIAINDLTEIDTLNIDQKHYDIMRQNVINIAHRLHDGFYTTNAIKQILREI